MENISHFHRNDLFFHGRFGCATLPLSTSPSRYEREGNVFIFYAVLTEMNQDVFKLMLFFLFLYHRRPPCLSILPDHSVRTVKGKYKTLNLI